MPPDKKSGKSQRGRGKAKRGREGGREDGNKAKKAKVEDENPAIVGDDVADDAMDVDAGASAAELIKKEKEEQKKMHHGLGRRQHRSYLYL